MSLTKAQTSSSLFNYKTESPDPPSARAPSDAFLKPGEAKVASNPFDASNSPASSSPFIPNQGQSSTTNGRSGSPSNASSIFDVKPPPSGAFAGFGAASSPGLFGTAEPSPSKTRKERGLVAPVRVSSATIQSLLIWRPGILRKGRSGKVN